MRKNDTKIVCMISMTDWIESGTHKKAVSLSRHGYLVKVFVLQGRIPEQDRRFESYEVIRIKLRLRKLLPRHLLFFYLKYLEFLWNAFWVLSKKRFDVAHCNDLETLPVGVLLKLIRGVRLVYVSDELNTEIVDLNPVSKGIWKVVEAFCIRSADAVFTVNESISSWLREKYRIPRPEILYNVPYRHKVPVRKDLRKMFGIPPDTRLLLYQGSMHPSRGVLTILRVLPRIKDAVLIIIGNKNQFMELVDRHHVVVPENVHVIHFVPYKELPAYTAGADIGLFLLENTCLSYFFSLPNKLFEYLSAGLPVIFSDFPEHRRIISAYDCGYLVNVKSDEDIITKIGKLMNDRGEYRRMSRNAKRVARELFNWEEEEKKLIRAYQKL